MNLILFLLWVVTIVTSCIYWYFKQIEKYRSINKIPGPPGLPIIGNILDLRTNSMDQIKNLYDLQTVYGNVYKLRIGPKNVMLIISDPKMIESILTHPHLNYRDFMLNILKVWFGKGLALSNGTYWQRHRKILNSAFNFKLLEQFLQVFHSNGNIFLEKIAQQCEKNNYVFDPFNDIINYLLDSLCETCMGTKIHAQNNPKHEYITAVKKLRKILVNRIFSPWKQNDALFKLSKSYKSMNENLDVVHNFVDKVIENRRKILLENNLTDENDEDTDVGLKSRTVFIDIILKSAMEEQSYTDKEIRDEVHTFMFAGHDTMASTAFFTLYAIAKYPDIQKKVFEEMNTIFNGDKKTELKMRDFQEMNYTECVVKETLRYYPPAPFFSRSVEKDMMYNGTFLPQGTVLIIFLYGLHRDPKYFKDPDVFNPDRFLPENASEIKSFSYIPFSAGPKNCIGQKYAMLQLKSFVSKIISNYEISLAEPDKSLDLSAELIFKPTEKVWFIFKKRV